MRYRGERSPSGAPAGCVGHCAERQCDEPLVEVAGTRTLQARIIDLAHARRRFGYRRIHDLLRREGVQANHKKVYRLYQRGGS